MQVLRDSSPLPPQALSAVAALGNFDGLHLGHQAVIGRAVSMARAARAPSMVITFEPHPRRLFAPDLPELRIFRLSEKMRLMQRLGVDFLRIIRFTRRFSETSAEDFIARDLHENLRISRVVTGGDFIFGHNRGGNAMLLEAMAKKLGFSATVCDPVMAEGSRSSSTRIREALREGKMEDAAKLLGRPYSLEGRVREGDKRGRLLGFPTANIMPPPVFLPAYGIYAVKAHVRALKADGVASFGIRPDFPLKTPLLEVHLFDWQDAVYGERMKVEFVHYLRPECKFDSNEALKSQIGEDCRKARVVLK